MNTRRILSRRADPRRPRDQSGSGMSPGCLARVAMCLRHLTELRLVVR
jgi:hypothetical protein